MFISFRFENGFDIVGSSSSLLVNKDMQAHLRFVVFKMLSRYMLNYIIELKESCSYGHQKVSYSSYNTQKDLHSMWMNDHLKYHSTLVYFLSITVIQTTKTNVNSKIFWIICRIKIDIDERNILVGLNWIWISLTRCKSTKNVKIIKNSNWDKDRRVNYFCLSISIVWERTRVAIVFRIYVTGTEVRISGTIIF